MNPIIEALALKELPAPETELLQKILNDNLITIRAQQLMIEHFAPEAIKQLHPVHERPAFLKRISPPPAAALNAPTSKVTWTIARAMLSQKAQIVAKRGAETFVFVGKPADAAHVVMCGEKVPPEVIAEYTRTVEGDLTADHQRIVAHETLLNRPEQVVKKVFLD
jgi:hypothetical protein